MPATLHTFFGIDSDTTPGKVGANRAEDMLNVVVERGYCQLAPGTLLLPMSVPLPAGRNVEVGKMADPEGQSVVYFLWNATGQHQLRRFSMVTGVSTVLLAAPELDLRETDEICQGGIIGPYLIWLDRDGIQYRLNMDVAAAGGYQGLNEPYILRLALPVPLFPLRALRKQIVAPADPRLGFNRIAGNEWH